MHKKSQVTSFILIGLFALIIISILLFVISSKSSVGKAYNGEFTQSTSLNPSQVDVFMRYCLSYAAESLLEDYSSTGMDNLTYYLINSTPIILRYDNESDITGYLHDNIETPFMGCLSDFSAFSKIGYEINVFSTPSFNILFNRKDITISLQYPLELSLSGSKMMFESTHIKLPIIR